MLALLQLVVLVCIDGPLRNRLIVEPRILKASFAEGIDTRTRSHMGVTGISVVVQERRPNDVVRKGHWCIQRDLCERQRCVV